MAKSRLLQSIVQRGSSIAVTVWLGAASAGCELFDALQDESSLILVSATHHGTPEDGAFPNHGDFDSRTYQTDLGWTVHVSEAHLTISEVTLQNCHGEPLAVEFHYGQFPEDLNEPDLQAKSLGSADAPATTYCAVAVTYSPYRDVEDKDVSTHRPNTDQILDSTLYLRGVATTGDERFPFEVRSNRRVEVLIDISALSNGRPFKVTGDESFPPELLLSKTYDRFFDGVDFRLMDAEDLEEQVWAVIDLETRVSQGAVPHGT